MRIEIAERLHPFSHLPGAMALVPGTSFAVQVFPARFIVFDLSSSIPKTMTTVDFAVEGPVDDFTVVQDLEKGILRIWGKAKNGFFRYLISVENNQMMLTVEKAPEAGLGCLVCEQGLSRCLLAKEQMALSIDLIASDNQSALLPRLSFGNHKAQNWEMIRHRRAMEEIFPLWYQLGKWISKAQQIAPTAIGAAALLENCRQAIEDKIPERVLQPFHSLFLAGFNSMLSPRLVDTDFQGIVIPEPNSKEEGSPLYLLSAGAELIERLFVSQKNGVIEILPALPPDFHCGRLLDVACCEGRLSMEWRKKVIRRLVFCATQSAMVSFAFSRGIKQCRLRLSEKDPGRLYRSGESLSVSAGENYWFDNFLR